MVKLAYFRLPSVKKFKENKEPIRFRFLKGYTLLPAYKHLGSQMLFKPGSFYTNKNISDEEALEKHPLKYTTSCGDQDAEKVAESMHSCIWCSKYVKGIKTLKRRKFVVGYVVSPDNEILILNLPKATLADSLMKLKTKERYNKWVELYLDKITVAGKEYETFKAKFTDTINKQQLEKMNNELIKKYGVDFDTFNLEYDPHKLLHYFEPEYNNNME